jgi:hypothetical protein
MNKNNKAINCHLLDYFLSKFVSYLNYEGFLVYMVVVYTYFIIVCMHMYVDKELYCYIGYICSAIL